MIEKALKDFHVNDYHKSTVIGELSGRDSVAAIMKAFEDEDIKYILPVATSSGTEYGDYDVIYENFKKMKAEVKKRYGDKKIVYPLIEYNREDIFALINGRYITELIKKFEFYSPCIGCHLYFHLTKIPFANNLSKRIISGERESHDGKVKVNQLHETLEEYKKILGDAGFDLLMPLQNIKDGSEIEKLIGFKWDEGKEHPKCVLSGNYRDISGKAVYSSDLIKKLFKGYLVPVAHEISKYFKEEITLETVKEKVEKII